MGSGQYNYLTDTIYYNQKWDEVQRGASYYFRPPPVAKGDLYKVDYYLVANPTIKVSEGYHKNKEREGEWIFYLEGTDRVRSRENYSKGKMHGQATYYNPESQKIVMEGTMKNGRPFGDCKIYYADGGIKRVVNYDSLGVVRRVTDFDSITQKPIIETDHVQTDTIRNGVFKYFHENSGVLDYVVTYKDDRWNGPLFSYDSLTQKLKQEGWYKNDMMDGEWKYYFPNGSLEHVSHFKNDLLEGYSFGNDSLTGKKVVEGYFVAGKKDGKWQHYLPTGELLCIENYKDGKLDGLSYLYDTTTHKLIVEGLWNHNKRKGTWKYYEPKAGKLIYEEHYKNDLLEGDAVVYSEKGNKAYEVSFFRGMMHGPTKFYYQDGNTWLKLNFQNDTLDGKMETFYANGKRKREDVYAAGTLTTGHCYNEAGKEIEYYPFYKEAQFPGDVMTYIGNNFKYPAEAKEKRIEGKVLMRFTIKKDGSLNNIEAIERIGGGCDEEAVRLVKNMPLWTPLYIDGQPVDFQKNLPIVFWLPEEKPDME